jgi:hypothetical protein
LHVDVETRPNTDESALRWARGYFGLTRDRRGHRGRDIWTMRGLVLVAVAGLITSVLADTTSVERIGLTVFAICAGTLIGGLIRLRRAQR